MRIVSIRLDDHTDALLRAFCEQHGVSEGNALKAAIEQLAKSYRPSPAELAAQLGLIGGFKSGSGANHSQAVKDRLRAKLLRESLASPAAASTGAVRRKSSAR